MKAILLASALLLGFAAALHASPPASVPLPGFETRLLAAHNAERLQLGQPALTWNSRLADSARKWAQTLAKNRSFEHAPQNAEGENLWSGTKGEYSPEEMVGLWIEEKQFFKSGIFPQVSTSGNWSDVGHYTQLIWYNTTQVGCAVAQSTQEDILVCRYDPPGNWIGKNPLAAVIPKTPAAKVGKPVKRSSIRKQM
jgi:uncharacterized protein YkwD